MKRFLGILMVLVLSCMMTAGVSAVAEDIPSEPTTIATTVVGGSQKFTYNVTLNNENYNSNGFTNGAITFTQGNGEEKTWHLPYGCYITVEQVPVDGYETSIAGKNINAFASGATISFTNTAVASDKGSLTVTNTVSSMIAVDQTKNFRYTVTLGDSTVNGTYGDMTFTDGKATVTLQHGQSKTAEGLAAGTTYTVTMKDESFTTTASGEEGTIVKDEVATAAFNHTRKTGWFAYTCNVDSIEQRHFSEEITFKLRLRTNEGQYLDETQNFGDVPFVNGTATLVLKHNETIQITGLPVGYRVDLFDPGFSETAAAELKMGGRTNGQIIREAGETYTITIVQKSTGLRVKVNVESILNSDEEYDFTYVVTLFDAHQNIRTDVNKTINNVQFVNGVGRFTRNADASGYKTINLPVGMYYQVEQEPAEGFETTVPENASGQLTQEARLTFKNARKIGSLTVTNTVKASDAAKDFSYKVTLDNNTISGTYGDMTFTNGVAEFTLGHNGAKTASGLPAVGYTVEQTVEEGFVLSKSGETGTITPEGVTAAFTNINLKSVSIAALDDANNSPLAGAKLQIVNSANTIVDEWISTADVHSVEGLVPGSYRIHCEAAPADYVVPADQSFAINEDGTLSYTGALSAEGVMLMAFQPMYNVTVHYGEGSGKYAEGTEVTITAEERSADWSFTDWTLPENLTIVSREGKSLTFIMPDKDVTVKANFKSSLPYHDAEITVNGRGNTQYTKVMGRLMPLGETTAIHEQELHNQDGEYKYIATIKDGLYNLVVTAEQADGKTVTVTTLVDLMGHNDKHDVDLPEAGKNSIVEDDTKLGIIVGGVEKIAEKQSIEGISHLAVKVEMNTKVDAHEGRMIGQQALADQKKVEKLLDIDLMLYKYDDNHQQIGNAVSLGNSNTEMLEILIPIDTKGRNAANFVVYRVHDGVLQKLPYGGESFEVGNGVIKLKVKKFSSYAIAYGEETVSVPPTGDSTPIALYAVMALISLCSAALLVRKQRKA